MTIKKLNLSEDKNNCIICQSRTRYYFSKEYSEYPGSPFPDGLKIDYHRCENCGFVLSKTHSEMSISEWSLLNSSWHHHFEQNIEDRITNQPPYADQALAIMLLSKNSVLDLSQSIDYAAGYGSLAKVLKKYFNQSICVFDPYVADIKSDLTYVEEAKLHKYKLVVNSAMFEHILKREHLDYVNELVDPEGVLMLHTVVCERIPDDPSWFYLTPMVHTAFHTNKSMSILMSQWGYSASLYSPKAKSWFLFKKDAINLDELESSANKINRELQTKYFYYKKGFVDYWKGF